MSSEKSPFNRGNKPGRPGNGTKLRRAELAKLRRLSPVGRAGKVKL
jgi:hypothetical protein